MDSQLGRGNNNATFDYIDPFKYYGSSSNRIQFSNKGPTGVTANKNLWQLYSCYDGFMTVWDIRLMEESIKPTSVPVPHLPSRVRPAFKVTAQNYKINNMECYQFVFLLRLFDFLDISDHQR